MSNVKTGEVSQFHLLLVAVQKAEAEPGFLCPIFFGGKKSKVQKH